MTRAVDVILAADSIKILDAEFAFIRISNLRTFQLRPRAGTTSTLTQRRIRGLIADGGTFCAIIFIEWENENRFIDAKTLRFDGKCNLQQLQPASISNDGMMEMCIFSPSATVPPLVSCCMRFELVALDIENVKHATTRSLSLSAKGNSWEPEWEPSY